MAAAGENGTVVLFDAESGTLRQRLQGHSKSEDVWDVVFHPRGAWLASAGDDRHIIRWSLPAGDAPAEQLQAWQTPAQVNSLAVSPDGTLLASGDRDEIISLWQAETGELVRRLQGHRGMISEGGGLAFSPSGKRLASGSYDDTARVWEVETGTPLQILEGHNGDVQGVAFGPDETRLATGRADKRLVLWAIESGRPLQVFDGHQSFVAGVGFVPRRPLADTDPAGGQGDAPLLVSSSEDRTLRVWDTDSGVTLRVLQGHTAGVGKIAVHAAPGADQGIQVFSASNDGTVRRWAVAPLPDQQLLDLPGSSSSAAIAPSGKVVAVGFDSGALRLYSFSCSLRCNRRQHAGSRSRSRRDGRRARESKALSGPERGRSDVDVQTIIPVFLAFFTAAFLKGITGLGFSTICLPILTMFIDLKMAIPLVIVPSLCSNVLVMVQAGRFQEAIGRFWPLYISALPGLILGVSVLTSVPSSTSRAVLGGVLLLYALWALRTQMAGLPKQAERWLAVPVGFLTGVVNGITGSQVMPVLPFLLALRLNKDVFVQAINLSFTLSSLIMLFLLSRVGLLSPSLVGMAAFGIVPVALGIFLGGRLRRALPEETFRKAVLLFLMVIGLSLMVRV